MIFGRQFLQYCTGLIICIDIFQDKGVDRGSHAESQGIVDAHCLVTAASSVFVCVFVCVCEHVVNKTHLLVNTIV